MCLGIPGRIVGIVDAAQQRALADVDGREREISVALLGIAGEDGATVGEGSDPVSVGDWVDIHLGFAMSRLDEHEALETLRGLRELAEAYEQEVTDQLGAASGGPRPGPAGGSP